MRNPYVASFGDELSHGAEASEMAFCSVAGVEWSMGFTACKVYLSPTLIARIHTHTRNVTEGKGERGC
jgi:hypothetical protein